jgi:hypothetical protein
VRMFRQFFSPRTGERKMKQECSCRHLLRAGAEAGLDIGWRGQWCELVHDPVLLRWHRTAGSGRILYPLG